MGGTRKGGNGLREEWNTGVEERRESVWDSECLNAESIGKDGIRFVVCIHVTPKLDLYTRDRSVLPHSHPWHCHAFSLENGYRIQTLSTHPRANRALSGAQGQEAEKCCSATQEQHGRNHRTTLDTNRTFSKRSARPVCEGIHLECL